ncbi:MAG: hypothetical protein R2761_19860 [Acidimicrobiales bacterium]
MKRKSALATAAAITGTLFAAGAATALNSAILGGAADATPSGLPSVLATATNDQVVESPTTVAAPPATEGRSPATVATLPPVRSPGAQPVSISAGSSVASGTGYDDDDHGEHEHEHEHEHEYEGSDDDD